MFVISNPIYGIECCATDGRGCDSCPYECLGKPDCMKRLIDDVADAMKDRNERIKEMEKDLRRARWGNNYY